jgi:hypothetical protein
MAKALTYRQVATNFTKQAEAFGRLAKLQNDAARAMPQGGAATAEQLMAALAEYDKAIRSYYTADSMETQAAEYNRLADENPEEPV